MAWLAHHPDISWGWSAPPLNQLAQAPEGRLSQACIQSVHRKSQGWILLGQCLQPQPWAALLSFPNSRCCPCLETRRQKRMDLSSLEC